tara:strand:- start:29 stop:214 length:186 start_codon:yes stop_codon:yes gene_type:complete
VSKIGGYLIDAEEDGELVYDEDSGRYIKSEYSGVGERYSFTERPKTRNRRKASPRTEECDE